MLRKIAVSLISLGLVFGVSATGMAYGQKSGYLYRSDCTIQPSDPWVRSLSTGTTNLKGPGRSYYVEYQNGTTQRDRYASGSYNGGYWRVYTSGSLSDNGTYGFCRNP